MNSTSLYFVSLLVEGSNATPTRISLSDADITYEQAYQTLVKTKEIYNAYSAWIDRYDSDGEFKTTVLHQCYI